MKLLCFDLGWLNGLKVCGNAVDQRLHVCNGLVLFRWYGLSGLFMKSLCQIVDEQVLLSHVLEEHGHQHAFGYIPCGNESHVATRAEQSQRKLLLALSEQEGSGSWEKERIHTVNIACPAPGGGLNLAKQWVPM